MHLDTERCYRAVRSRDERFDGWFFTAVTTTGIYCRPSCPAITPKRANVRFHPTAAAAQQAGFRACRRCRPDAVPGSPEWDIRSDVVARAMRLIADGVVDREGVSGLASRLGYSTRHLNRQLTDAVGAGPLALARARRAHTARLLIEGTTLPLARVAFAAGFASVRQFNDTVRHVYACTPGELRRTGHGAPAPGPGRIDLRLAFRRPFAFSPLLRFLAARAIPGVEEATPEHYSRALRLPHGEGVVELAAGGTHVTCRLQLTDLRDLGVAVQRCRNLLDLDADPVAVDELFADDPWMAPLVTATPGRRVVRTVDPAETAVRAVLGQQVSVTAARTVAARLTTRFGKPLTAPAGTITHLFPDVATIADLVPADLPLPRARATGLQALAAAIADGTVVLDAGADRRDVATRLRALPGIGPWTAAYIALRATADPDVFPASDLGLRKAAAALGLPATPAALVSFADRWRPWRSYAAEHLWSTLT